MDYRAHVQTMMEHLARTATKDDVIQALMALGAGLSTCALYVEGDDAREEMLSLIFEGIREHSKALVSDFEMYKEKLSAATMPASTSRGDH